MNEVFLIGKVMTEVDFDFIINSKRNKSISIFTMQTLNKQCLKICAFNELADFAYSKLKMNELVFVYGFLSKNSVICRKIKKI